MLRNISDNVWGEQTILSGSPRVEGYQNAQLVPLTGFPDHDPLWGAYDANGSLIELAAYKRGPGRQLLGQSETLNALHEFHYVDALGIYGGLNLPYYGHYLLSTLSRYWYDTKKSHPGVKIYLHLMEGLGDWYARPFVSQTMSALGLSADDFVAIDRPLRLRNLIVPGPAFIEQSQAYRKFDDVGRKIGEAALGGGALRRPEPVYLSKEHLKSGVWTATNESEIVLEMRRAGVRVIHPETMPLVEQIRVFFEHRTILGFAGSGLHTSLLTEGGHKIVALCPISSVNSNFVLIDLIKNNNSYYLGLDEGLRPSAASPNFGSMFEIPEPKAVAEKMLNLAI